MNITLSMITMRITHSITRIFIYCLLFFIIFRKVLAIFSVKFIIHAPYDIYVSFIHHVEKFFHVPLLDMYKKRCQQILSGIFYFIYFNS